MEMTKEEVCQNWGYENSWEFMKPDDPKRLRWLEAKKRHAQMEKEDPEHHKLVVCTDTIRGDHHRQCSCGFAYAWDSSD